MSKLTSIHAIENAQRDILRASIWLIGSSVIVMLMSASLFAQDPPAEGQFEVLPLPAKYVEPEEQENESRDQARARRAAQKVVRDAIRTNEKDIALAIEGSGDFNSISSRFNDFMREYVFARMTQTGKGDLATLGEMREDFLKDYLSDKVRGNTRQRVIQTTLPIMQQISEGNFHPAARLNAVTLMGMLDDQAASRTGGTLPTPSVDALRYLTQVFTGDNYPSYLKVGALAGIQRHAEIDRLRTQPRMTNRNAILAEALAIVQNGGSGSANWSEEAKYWLKRRSIQVLGLLGQPGNNGAVVDELTKIAADENASTWLRFDAISALGGLNLAGVNAQKVAEVPTIVGRFVAEILADESNDLREKLDNLIAMNILYDDKDLVEIGNAEDDKNKRPERNIGVGMGAGGAAETFGKKKKEIDLGPRVEIATYHLNNSRQKVKVVAYTAKQTLSSDSLKALVDAALVAKLDQELQNFIIDSDVGIKDLGAPELELDEDDPLYEEKLKAAKKTNTLKMSDLYAAAARDILRLLPADPADAADDASGSN